VAQDCAQAIPICRNTPVNGGTQGYGLDDFNGQDSTGCLEQSISGGIESNSAWYRFRTGASGELGFNIGHDPGEDWDFALYRASDCGQLGEPIRCNFFDNREGVRYMGVGEDPSGQGDSLLYEPWLEVGPGEDYYLMINNYSNLNSGFSIQFTGSIWVSNPLDALDCSIIDNLLGAPVAACGNENVVLDATLSGAVGYQWYRDVGTGFQQLPGMDTPTLSAMESGIYRVVVDRGGSSLLSDVQVGFSASPQTQPVQDMALCHQPDMEFDLSTLDAQALGFQDPKDFVVSYHLSQRDAESGTHPLNKIFSPQVGRQDLFVRIASLANPQCYDASVGFVIDVLQPPVIGFPLEVVRCGSTGPVEIGEENPDPGYEYLWDTGERTPSLSVSGDGEHTLTVIQTTSMGDTCTTNRTIRVTTSQVPVITKLDIEDMRANNRVTVHPAGSGRYEFSMDDGPFQASNVFSGVPPGIHSVVLRDFHGCGELREEIVVVGFAPSFSPNGDVLNETWQIGGLSTLDGPIVTIYDRYGKLIKQMDQNDVGWDGSFNGSPMPSTDYWFKLSYRDSQGNRTYAKYLQSHFSLRR